MKRILIGLLAIVLTSCATGADRPNWQAQLSEEGDRFTDVSKCHVTAAWDLDDGRSDASSIAHAVRSRCSLEEMRAAMTVRQGDAIFGKSPGQSPAELEQRWENEALEAVLQERRNRAAPSN